jgi:hypothetical protein
MARFGMEHGERGSLETSTDRRGVTKGYFVPKESSSLNATAKVAELDPGKGELRIFPTNTLSGHTDFLGPKHKQIKKITLPVDADEYTALADVLHALPSGFTKDPEYGLGLARECDPIIAFIEENTGCTAIELVHGSAMGVRGSTFRLGLAQLAALRAQMDRIKSRGDGGIRRVKGKHVHDTLRSSVGLDSKTLSLGRLPDSQWMTKVAAGEVPLNEDEQDELLAATTASAASIALSSPQKLVRLQGDIQLVNLSRLIEAFELALGESQHEDWWQKFFEENVFVLQLIFGGPTVFIDSQVPIGDGTSTKGKKIADYLFKNALTDNAALVEIKKPTTQLLSKTPYRAGVYGVHSEIGKAVTQVLDQAGQLVRSEAETRRRTGDGSWSTSAPRCFVVAGRAAELDTGDKRKSFELYREHLAGVRLVSYDEIFEQLKALRDFLAAGTSE